ncbi:unnamed protein product [Camellia sinensis]
MLDDHDLHCYCFVEETHSGFVDEQPQLNWTCSPKRRKLCDLQQDCGNKFPGCDSHPPDQKNWMSGLNIEKVHLNKVVASVDFVIQDIKKFLSETQSEIIILEIRTEYVHNDPPEFNKYLKNQLAEFLIHQDDH